MRLNSNYCIHLANLEVGLLKLFYLLSVNTYDLGKGLEVTADTIERQLEIGGEAPIRMPGK